MLQPQNYKKTLLCTLFGVGVFVLLKRLYDYKYSQRKSPYYKNNSNLSDDLFVHQDDSPLIEACKQGDLDLVRKIVESSSKESVKKVNSHNWTPLHMSVFVGDEAIFQYLFEKDTFQAHFKDVTFEGWSILHLAAIQGFSKILSLILSRCPELLELKDNYGQTPLVIAACAGHSECVKELLSKGASPLERNNKLEGSLFYSSANGYGHIVEALIAATPPEKRKELLDAMNLQGGTALHAACQRGHKECVEVLLRNGADINATRRDGNSPLHSAAASNSFEVVALLLRHSADASVRNRFGSTPLHDAAFLGLLNTVKAFVEAKVDLEVEDNDGLTALHRVCQAHQPEKRKTASQLTQVALFLLASGANPNARDTEGHTPLHLAVCAGPKGLEFIRILLSHGADISLTSAAGWTAYHLALRRVEKDASEFLTEWLTQNNPAFLSSFSVETPLEPYIIKEVPTIQQKLTLEEIVEKLKAGSFRRIVVLAGAGISVSAGIPDYRTPNTGLYPKLAHRNFSGSLDLETLHRDPEDFYQLVFDHFAPILSDSVEPSIAHRFLRVLEEKQKLLRIYTQNVDGLEFKANISRSLVFQAHGSLDSWSCLNCRDNSLSKEQVYRSIKSNTKPLCPKCKAFVRPDVVFFGEGLESSFYDSSLRDLREADLLIVMGTSLKVYPFAGLLSDVAENVPRVLINEELVGGFRTLTAEAELEAMSPSTDGVKIVSISHRDLALIGKADDAVTMLTNLLGWSQL